MIYKTLSLLIVFVHFWGANKSQAQCSCDHLTDIQIKLRAVVQQADVDGWYIPWDLLEQEVQLEEACGQTTSIFASLINKYPNAFKSKPSKQTQIKNILAGMLEIIEESKKCKLIYNDDDEQIDKLCPTTAFKGLLDELATTISHCFLTEIEETELASVRN